MNAKITLSHSDFHRYKITGFSEAQDFFKWKSRVRIIEKIFDIREKRCNFVYRHGFELVFWWYLKLLIFLQLGKNPCRFFMTLPLEISTCET